MKEWQAIGRYEVEGNARSLVELLTESGFRMQLREERRPYDAVTGQGPWPSVFWVYVWKGELWELRRSLPDLLGDPPEDHPLWQVEDLALIGVLRDGASWGEEYVALAQRVLRRRGLPIPAEVVAREMAAGEALRAAEGLEKAVLPVATALAVLAWLLAWRFADIRFVWPAAAGLVLGFVAWIQAGKWKGAHGVWSRIWAVVVVFGCLLSAYLALWQR